MRLGADDLPLNDRFGAPPSTGAGAPALVSLYPTLNNAGNGWGAGRGGVLKSGVTIFSCVGSETAPLGGIIAGEGTA